MTTEKYTHRLEVRLTSADKRKVRKDAHRAQLTQTDYIRKCLGLAYDTSLEEQKEPKEEPQHGT